MLGAETFLVRLFSISRTELTSVQQVLTYTSVTLRGRSGLLRDDSTFCAWVFYLVKQERNVTGRKVSG